MQPKEDISSHSMNANSNKSDDGPKQEETTMTVRFLMSTGDSKVFEFPPSNTVAQTKKYIFENWPPGKRAHLTV